MIRTDSEYYLPGEWGDFIGNERAVAHFRNLVRLIRIEHTVPKANTMFIGPPGSGKSALVRKFAQCILCQQLNPQTLNNCGKCDPCTKLAYLEGNDSIETRIMADESPIDAIFSPIGCVGLNAAAITEILEDLKWGSGVVRIAHFEEVGFLAEKELDAHFNIPMDDRGFIWIATGMSYEGLSTAFMRRFDVKLRISPPDADSLALWLTKRAVERQIRCQDLETMQRLAVRSGLRPGIALQVLNYVNTFPTESAMITRNLVEDFIFSFDE